MQQDAVTNEPVSLPSLFSPTTTDTFKFSQEVNHKVPTFVARSYKSLPVLQRAGKGAKPHKPLLAKVASFASPRISASQRSGHKQRSKKYVVPLNHSKKDRILDIESVKTTSVSSLATMKSSTTARKRQIMGRKGYISRKDVRDMALQEQPKLSQATRNRLREARTVITSNDAVTSSRLSVSTQSTPYHTRNLHQPAARAGTEAVKTTNNNNNNNSGPRRKPAAGATGRGGGRRGGEGGGPKERLQTRLVPSKGKPELACMVRASVIIFISKVTVGDSKFTSPYLSSPVPQHKKNGTLYVLVL